MSMIPKTVKTTTATAYGVKLPAPIPYEFSFSIYGENADVKAANDMLSDDEQRKVRNTERKTKARQAALTAALDAAGIVKPDIDNNDQLRLKEMFKVLMSSKKYTVEAAREKAAENLGLEWDEDGE